MGWHVFQQYYHSDSSVCSYDLSIDVLWYAYVERDCSGRATQVLGWVVDS